jgi:hypothetical protein
MYLEVHLLKDFGSDDTYLNDVEMLDTTVTVTFHDNNGILPDISNTIAVSFYNGNLTPIISDELVQNIDSEDMELSPTSTLDDIVNFTGADETQISAKTFIDNA